MSNDMQGRQRFRGNRFMLCCLLAGGTLTASLGIPLGDHTFGLTPAYAHHGGGGGGGAGGGGGKIGINKAATVPPDGYGKGGRGTQGLKP